MLFGQRTGLAASGGLGDIVSEQSASPAVADVQKILNVLSAAAAAIGVKGAEDISVGTETYGKVGFRTVSALYFVSRRLSQNIPIVSNIVNLITSAPGVSLAASCFDTRWGGYCSFERAWDVVKLTNPGWLTTNLINPIRNKAASIASELNKVASQLPDAAGGGGVRQMQVATGVIQAKSLPPGTVAVRDPLAGQYRLVVKL